MGNRIIKIASWMLSSFFFLILLLRLFNMVSIDLHLLQIMNVTFFLAGIFCMRKTSMVSFDIIIVLYIAYMLLNGLIIDYNYHGEFLYRALLIHVFPVMCYFIGRYTKIDIDIYLDRMKWPILFAMICGIVFYFLHPSWYVSMKEAQLQEYANEMRIAEIYRLSSFWGHPYALAYATFLYSIFITKLLICGIYKKKDMIICTLILFICIAVLLLAQLRVTIVVYALSIVYMIGFLRQESPTKKIKMIFILTFLVVSLFYLIVQLDSNNIEYITNHITNLMEENSMSNRFEHTAGGITSYSLFGDGLGRYGYPARTHGMWAIVDNEFQCHIAELGYIGISLLCSIILLTVLRCIKRSRLVLENIIISFFFLSMIGASVLSNHHQYNFIFWYTLGLLWSNKYKCVKMIKSKEK